MFCVTKEKKGGGLYKKRVCQVSLVLVLVFLCMVGIVPTIRVLMLCSPPTPKALKMYFHTPDGDLKKSNLIKRR